MGYDQGKNTCILLCYLGNSIDNSIRSRTMTSGKKFPSKMLIIPRYLPNSHLVREREKITEVFINWCTYLRVGERTFIIGTLPCFLPLKHTYVIKYSTPYSCHFSVDRTILIYVVFFICLIEWNKYCFFQLFIKHFSPNIKGGKKWKNNNKWKNKRQKKADKCYPYGKAMLSTVRSNTWEC